MKQCFFLQRFNQSISNLNFGACMEGKNLSFLRVKKTWQKWVLATACFAWHLLIFLNNWICTERLPLKLGALPTQLLRTRKWDGSNKNRNYFHALKWKRKTKASFFVFQNYEIKKEISEPCSGYTGPSSTLTSPLTGNSSGLLQVCTLHNSKISVSIKHCANDDKTT